MLSRGWVMSSNQPSDDVSPAESDVLQIRRPHGRTSFERIVTAGAFAASDELPPNEPDDPRGRPRWPRRFGLLVDAYGAEQAGNLEELRNALRSAEVPFPEDESIAEAVVHVLEVEGRPDRDQFDSLFGWLKEDAFLPNAGSGVRRKGDPFIVYASLPMRFRPIWMFDMLCCALAFRRNTFGRYFSKEPLANLPSEDSLRLLAAQMNEAFETVSGDPEVPAGFTFLGQLVDHDITFDTTTRLSDLSVDATAVTNVRSPALDLDNVYGDGPDGSPELYDPRRGHGFLLVGTDGKDLARNQVGTAIIGDPRNDENTIVSQLHLHFLHFHNGVLRMAKNTPVAALWGRRPDEQADDQGDFEFARRMVRWHYQWALVNDWLPRVVDGTTLHAAHAITGVPQGPAVPALPAGFSQAQSFFDTFLNVACCGTVQCRPLMPVEFSAAAFRFAHSEVRSRYDLNDGRLAVPLFAPRPPGLASFDPVPAIDLVAWERFFETDPGVAPQLARRIDTWLAAQVFQLPFASGDDLNLAFRNLRRGSRVYALRSGPDLAGQLGLTTADERRARRQARGGRDRARRRTAVVLRPR